MEQTVRISDFYMPMLTRLSDDDKLDIISRLAVTIRSKSVAKREKPDIRTCFSGNWENEKSTVQVADELRAAMHYERNDAKAETMRQQLAVKQSLTQAFKELAEAEQNGVELPMPKTSLNRLHHEC